MAPLIELFNRIDAALFTPTTVEEIQQLLVDCRSQLGIQETTINIKNKRPVRILRVLEYVGDRDWIEDAIARRGVKGTYNCGGGRSIREAIIGETCDLLPENDNEQAGS